MIEEGNFKGQHAILVLGNHIGIDGWNLLANNFGKCFIFAKGDK